MRSEEWTACCKIRTQLYICHVSVIWASLGCVFIPSLGLLKYVVIIIVLPSVLLKTWLFGITSYGAFLYVFLERQALWHILTIRIALYPTICFVFE
jgi:hypothetical protein